jgi:dynactin-5
MSWIETSTGNRISKSATITGSHKILINGNTTINTEVTLNGDVTLADKAETSIQIGKYSYLGLGSQIIPPLINQDLHGPISIGAYCIIGENSVIRLATIGNRVIIEDDCSLGNLSIIYDCCIIKKGTVIPPKVVIPPYSVVSGVPGVDYKVEELHNCYKRLIEQEARDLKLLG